MAKNPNECPVTGGCDCVGRVLCRCGINRSLLVTFALIPFAWRGVVFTANAIMDGIDIIAGAVTQ